MAPRLTLKRVGAAVLGASLFALTAALPAAADAVEVKPFPGADEPGMGVHLKKDGKDYNDGKPVNAELIGLKITEGGEKDTATAYCVELPTRLEDNTPLEEVPWGEHPNPETKFKENAAKVNWILHHSYPKLDVATAAKELGAEGAKRSSVIAATQAAIWHFTDGVDLNTSNATAEVDDVDADVLAMYKKLTENNPGLDQEPNPTLKIDPKELEGKAGTLIGPFVISTTATTGTIEANLPTGIKFTNKEGAELDVAAKGDLAAASQVNIAEVYVKVDEGVAPGEVEFTVRATAELQHGRLFVAKDRNQKTQSLVIAKPTPASVKDTAKVKWTENVVPTSETTTTTTTTTTTAPTTTTTPAPAAGGGEDDLAQTGASIFVPLLIGLGLLGAGAAALIVVRRKKAA
ncbi:MULTISPECIES: thioester domain-containing protein [unclassified Saccharothrix]|uniref:thioester domain-containing protein n=1 Tax=unclassified Saccharothrix TaxID=2593673 RepID=UPI00307DCD37